MKNSLFLATILLMAVTGSLGGRITPWGDIDIFNPNSKYISYMNLYFTLDTNLPAGHVLRVTLPFTTTLALNTSSTASTSSIYAASSSSKGTYLTSTLTAYTAPNFVKLSGSAPYTAYFTFPLVLAAATPYVFKLVFSTSPSDSAGFIGWVQMETLSPALSVATVSGSGDIPITYDLNNAFAPVQIFTAPGTISTYTITSDTNSTVGAASSVRQIAFVPSQNFFYWPTIQLNWDNTNFAVSSVVSIDTGTSTSTTNPLNFSTSGAAGTYWTTSTTSSISIYHNQPLFTTQTVKYNITTANPAASQTINFWLKVFHRYNYNLTDISTNITISVSYTPAVTSSTTTAINAYQILLSWGVDPQAGAFTSNYPSLAKVFTLYASVSTNPIYQAVRWVFGVNNTLSGSYMVNVTICTTGTSCDILENSLVSNITGTNSGATCFYGWPLTTTSAKFISCNTTGISTTGNMIGGRIWLKGASTTGSGNMVTAPTTYTSTLTDTTFGTITILLLSSTGNTFTTTATAGITTYTTYNVINYNTAPLANINGNGPLAAIPAGSVTTINTSTSYAALWTGIAPSTSAAVGVYTGGVVSTAPSAATPTAAQFGGIYGTANSAQAYNLALYTSAQMVTATGTNQFGQTVAAVSSVNTASGFPGVDIFMNPNLYQNGGSSTSGSSVVTSCWIANTALKPTAAAFSSSYDATSSAMSTTCFSNNIALSNANYLRLRLLTTTLTGMATNIVATAVTGGAVAPDSLASTPTYMIFYWESGVKLSAAYAGASLRADSLIGDFYGVFYSLAGGSTYPIRSGGTNPTDLGELTSTMSGFTYTLGTPFFWTQPIVGPYGTNYLGTGASTDYFNKKSVFISGYGGFTSGATSPYNTNTMVNLIRVRGSLNTTTGGADVGTYPASGKLALFLGTLSGATVIEPLGGVNTTNAYGVAGYNSAGPLAGNGAVRCFSSGSQTAVTCMQEKYGRVLGGAPFASTSPSYGQINLIDQYGIIDSSVTYTSGNFSLAILVKPITGTVAATFAKYYYRFGFVYNASYYMQSWDQLFDNGAAIGATGTVTNMGVAFTLGSGTTYQYPTGTTSASCALPYVGTGTPTTNAPPIRITPNPGDVDNSLASANVTLSINQGISGATTFTPAKLQGQIIWCVQWNFAVNSASFSINSSSLENSTIGDKCSYFDYLSAESPSLQFYCIFCPIANTAATVPSTGTAITANLANFFDGPATNIPTSSFTNFANDVGLLTENSNCLNIIGSSTNLWTPQTFALTTPPASSYAVLGQKLTIGFTAPSTLSSSLVDTITFTGKINATTTADTAFPYGTLDGAAVCKLVPTASVSNYSLYIGCIATASSGTLVINAFSSSMTSAYSSVTGWTLYIWGFNGSAALTNTTVYYVATTSKTNSSFIVDQSSNTSTTYASWTLSNATATLSTPNILYQRNFVNARGWFRFDIVFTPRTWFYSDKVVMSLDGIASATVNSNASVVKCRITDTSDNILQGFQSCTFAPGSSPTVTIIALTPSGTVNPYDFSASTGVRIYLDNIVTMAQSTNKTIYGSITFMGTLGNGSTNVLTKAASTTSTDIAPVSLTTVQSFSTTPTITKWWYAANDLQDIIFTMVTGAPFNSTGRITIVFPSYYNPGLTTRSATPYCTVNSVYTQCLVGVVTTAGVTTLSQGQRQLVIYGTSTTVATNGTIAVRVNGISAPPASYATETFWIQINGDNTENAATIIYAGAVTDASYSAPTTAILPLNVIWFGRGRAAADAADGLRRGHDGARVE